MARKFIDTSGVVKLYIIEADTPTVQACVLAATELLIARLTPLEFRSTMYRKVREGRLTLAAAGSVLAAFAADLPNFTIIAIDEETSQQAEAPLDTYAPAVG